LGRVGESRDWGVRSRFRRGGLRGPLGLSRFLLFGRGGRGLRNFFFRLRFRDCLLCSLQSFGSGCVPAARFEWVFEGLSGGRRVHVFGRVLLGRACSLWGFWVFMFIVEVGCRFFCVRAVMCAGGAIMYRSWVWT